WPYFYISVGTGEHPLTRLIRPVWKAISGLFPSDRSHVSDSDEKSNRTTFAAGYHGKVVPLEGAKRLVQVDQDIYLRNPEQVIPYSRARDIVLQNPGHIVALECPCRTSRPDPCLPLDVCLIIGDPFAGFVTEHHPRRSREISREEAMEILQAEHERGHVHHAFFKDAMLDRFYAICNCCSCCCGAMQAWRSGIPMLASSGFVSRIRGDICIACGDCVEICPFGALQIGDGGVVVDEGLCMGCGVCVSICDQGAHQLVCDPARGEPLEVQPLAHRA
ncbi:MAG TPA: 4Fe-4S binding protein, partial [bacterium]|nr:4Fe-4S binding protein [bacterium]